MVISRNDLKRKRRKECAGLTHIAESPKRTKVHAQRKFAQGSNVNSPVITPVKELENKDSKPPKVELSTSTAEILPEAKRPNTEDFLTFLCFRGTPILPPTLNFFSSVSLQQPENVVKVTESPPKVTEPEPKPPFIAFGVRKRADPFINNKLEKKRRHALAIQALRRKYQEQRMAKIRSVTINQHHTQQKTTRSTVTSKNVVTVVPKQTTSTSTKVKVKVVSTKIQTTKLKRRISRTTIKQHKTILPTNKTVSIVNNKQKMCLRSRSGRLIHRELITVKKRKIIKKTIATTENRPLETRRRKRMHEQEEKQKESVDEQIESEFESEDDQPLVKTVKRVKPSAKSVKTVAKKIVKKPPVVKKAPEVKAAAPVKKQVPKVQTPAVLVPTVETKPDPEIKTSRPTRKTKEAAAIYMELLGHKLVNDTEIDEDNVSIDSFPELPNVKKTEQREIELKKLNKTKKQQVKIQKPVAFKKCDKIVTRSTKILNKAKETLVKKKFRKADIPLQRKMLRSNCIFPTAAAVKTIQPKIRKVPKVKGPVKDKLEQSFSDSDEEPLSKLTTKRKQLLRKSKIVFSVVGNKPIPTVKKMKRLAFVKKKMLENEIAKKKIEALTSKKNETATSKKIEQPLKKVVAEKKPVKKTENPVNIVKTVVEVVKKTEETKVVEEVKPQQEVRKTRNDTRKSEAKKVQQEKKKEKKVEVVKEKEPPLKKPQPILLSSDDEEKVFRGFFKTENQEIVPKMEPVTDKKCSHEISCADLLCKEVGRRFGKGKVNMSNEQIEKWLKDSALAGNNMKKEEDEEILDKFEMESTTTKPEEPPAKPKTAAAAPEIVKEKKAPQEKIPKACEKPKAGEIKIVEGKSPPDKKSIFVTSNSRRSLLNRDKKHEPVKNVNAFSVQNESSVYAFEADIDETPLSTPFRRPSRRPSSTTTSKSEDDPAAKPLDISTTQRSEGVEPALDLGADTKRRTTPKFNRLPPLFSKTAPHRPEEAFKATMNSSLTANAAKVASNHMNGPMCPPKTTATAKVAHASKTNASPTIPTHAASKETSPNVKRHQDNNVPSSPSASSMSSASVPPPRVIKNLSKGGALGGGTTKKSSGAHALPPVASNACKEFPTAGDGVAARMVEAPTFHPTDKEFQDPVEYISKIRVLAERFGICRIVPPANFKPECKVSDDMRFTAYNQYVHKMLHRWGPNFKELMAIKKYLATQSITLTQPPWIGGMEIDLPRLYQTVQNLGGLKEVIEKKKWPKVAEGMKIPKSAQDRVTKLDDIYCKYLLPYDTLSPAERQKLFDEVETEWAKRESRSLLRSQRQHPPPPPAPSGGADAQADADDEDEDEEEMEEECITKGRNMALNAFYRIARNTMSMWFRSAEPQAPEVETEFWKHVQQRQNHLCVHSGSIDCGGWGYGFACTKNSPFARHAWNLKVLTNNSGNVLRSMGPLMGVTVPTLHVGMVFSAVCWYRDPHALPWIEYLHTGANKIWYGVPDSISQKFHAALMKLVPSYCRNKKLWLSSDTAMVPPSVLLQNGVSLCRTVQEPGQFIVVFPKAFTSSLCTGYLVSESVYFAPSEWLSTAGAVFQDIRDSCEPSMFSLVRLMVSIANDPRTNVNVLKSLVPRLQDLCAREKAARKKLTDDLGLKTTEKLPLPDTTSGGRKKRKAAAAREQDGEFECEVCRMNLFVSMVTNVEEEVDFCLEHGYEHLLKDKNRVKNCKLMFTYEEKDLDELVSKLQMVIENKLIKKIPGKFCGMPTLLK